MTDHRAGGLQFQQRRIASIMWTYLLLLLLYVTRGQSRVCNWYTVFECEELSSDYGDMDCVWLDYADEPYCVSIDCVYITKDQCESSSYEYTYATCYWNSIEEKCYSDKWWSAAYSMEEEHSDKGGMASGDITAIVVCMVLLCGMVVALSFWCRRQNAKSKRSSDVDVLSYHMLPDVNENGNTNSGVAMVNLQRSCN